ncbi:hypothetical protein SynRS9909_01366 [Synechococcus sp. RS9909]|nr:hypothetical protein RS9917_13145 [Synechococcus sp. RS9917]QNI79353.1 hypothetical protein SynRS9909_01366 [Synechococcus sp. RS9909]
MAARITKDEFLARAQQRFGDRFDYSGIHYRSYKSPIKIICRKHPVQPISITPEKHLQTTGGCRHCLREKRVESLERELNRQSPNRPSPERQPETPISQVQRLALLALLLAASLPVQAGSITAESVWSEDDATQRAEVQVPKNSTVTDSQCETIQVRNSDRYRCTVFFKP